MTQKYIKRINTDFSNVNYPADFKFYNQSEKYQEVFIQSAWNADLIYNLWSPLFL